MENYSNMRNRMNKVTWRYRYKTTLPRTQKSLILSQTWNTRKYSQHALVFPTNN